MSDRTPAICSSYTSLPLPAGPPGNARKRFGWLAPYAAVHDVPAVEPPNAMVHDWPGDKVTLFAPSLAPKSYTTVEVVFVLL